MVRLLLFLTGHLKRTGGGMDKLVRTVLDYVPYDDGFAIQVATTQIDLTRSTPELEQATGLLRDGSGQVRAFANEDLAAHYVLSRAIYGNADVAAKLGALMSALHIDVTGRYWDAESSYEHPIKNDLIDELHSLYDVGFVTIGANTQELLRGENIGG